MARRSKPAGDTAAQLQQINNLLGHFEAKLSDPDLREKVIALVPAIDALRDLGSGLIDPAGKMAAKTRIIKYLKKYPFMVIDGPELAVVSGIGEWARRVRELRKQDGWSIYTGVTIKEMAEDNEADLNSIQDIIGSDPLKLKPSQYILISITQDREAAFRWKTLNDIRKSKGGMKNKMLDYFRKNVGHVVTGEELKYLVGENSTWARRVRELRTEDGWPIVTKMQGRPDLNVGEYLLEEDRQAPPHDRNIPDDVRIQVLERDGFTCTHCGWTREQLRREDPRKFLELHHLTHHKDGGANDLENLKTYCNVHHDDIHAGRLKT